MLLPLLVGFALVFVASIIGIIVGAGLRSRSLSYLAFSSTWFTFVTMIALRLDGATSASWYIVFIPFWAWAFISILHGLASFTRKVSEFEEGYVRTVVSIFVTLCLLIQGIFVPLSLERHITWKAQQVLAPLLLLACFHLLWLILGPIFRPHAPKMNSPVLDGSNVTLSWHGVNSFWTLGARVLYLIDFKCGRESPWQRSCVVSTPSATVPNLAPGQLYLFRVRAVVLTGERPRDVVSHPVNTKPVPPPIPGAPTVTRFVRFFRKDRPLTLPHEYYPTFAAAVEWGAVEGDAEYILEASAMLTDDSCWTVVYKGRAPRTRMTKLLPATTFRIRVCSVNFVGSSPYSDEIWFTTPHMGEVGWWGCALLRV